MPVTVPQCGWLALAGSSLWAGMGRGVGGAVLSRDWPYGPRGVDERER